MIRCPNCESTTQIRIIQKERTYSADIFLKHSLCACGCGKRFWYTQGFNEFGELSKEEYIECN